MWEKVCYPDAFKALASFNFFIFAHLQRIVKIEPQKNSVRVSLACQKENVGAVNKYLAITHVEVVTNYLPYFRSFIFLKLSFLTGVHNSETSALY